MKISKEIKEWLLSYPQPYVQYNAQMFFTPKKADKKILLKDEFIKSNIEYLKKWD